MAPRKRKKAPVDEGLFLFSEEEMAGKIENVTIVQTPEPVKTEEPPKENTETVSEKTVKESFSHDRMIAEMAAVLRQMVSMDESKIRLIALTTTMKGQQGLDLNETYCIPAVSDSEISGYELAAWCYCSFMAAFPQMKDKLQMPYATHYEKAKAYARIE